MIDAPEEQVERQLRAWIVDAVGSIPFETLLERAAGISGDEELLGKPSWLTMAAVVAPEDSSARMLQQIRDYADASDPKVRVVAADAALYARWRRGDRSLGARYTGVFEAAQADLATRFMTQWKSYEWAGNVYWYDLRDDDGGDSTIDREEHFGALRADDRPKPAYDALRIAYTTP